MTEEADKPQPTDWMEVFAQEQTPRTGRPVQFNPEVAERVCVRIAEGRSIRAACDLDGLPNWRTFMRWLASEDEPKPEGDLTPGPFAALRQQYARAREIRADSRFEGVDAILTAVALGQLKPEAGRVMIDAIKWQAGKENKRYADSVTLKGDKDNPLMAERSPQDLSREELIAIARGGIREAG